MANGVFNIAKGAAAQLVRDNTNSIAVLLLKAAEADSALVDHDDVDALLTAAGNTECDFTNYARKTGLSGTVTVDDTANAVYIDIDDQTWVDAGNGTNNTIVKVVVAVQTGTGDTDLVPLTHHDVSITTDGSSITIQIDEDGVYSAS